MNVLSLLIIFNCLFMAWPTRAFVTYHINSLSEIPVRVLSVHMFLLRWRKSFLSPIFSYVQVSFSEIHVCVSVCLSVCTVHTGTVWVEVLDSGSHLLSGTMQMCLCRFLQVSFVAPNCLVLGFFPLEPTDCRLEAFLGIVAVHALAPDPRRCVFSQMTEGCRDGNIFFLSLFGGVCLRYRTSC